MNSALMSLTVALEHDVVAARQRARQIAALLGFDAQDQTRIATAVSEIVRNAFVYSKGGRVEFLIEGKTAPQLFVVRVTDTGKGIPNLGEILGGRYKSQTGMGVGILGAKRLMDGFDIETSEAGTRVLLKKLLPRKAPLVTPAGLARVAAELASQRPQDALAEFQTQNQELLRTLGELRVRQEELVRINRELEDTNRGVVALYAELEERADHLRRADEVKTRFLSNMTHEFRTPVNSILALSRLLLEHADGELNHEQNRQVGFIQKGAQDLSELVNDLLDLAKVEAGKVVVYPADFEIESLFGALRGMLRPLLVSQSVALVFEEPSGIPVLHTDESKVSQILRNFISNALKFTERGEVRISARPSADARQLIVDVTDTGIGIAPEDHARIFEEFGQLDNPIQRRVKGTGLGLPLSKRLAQLLGGDVGVRSTPGQGSTFTLTIPVQYQGAPGEPEPVLELEPTVGQLNVLSIEDRPEDRLVYERQLRGTPFHLVQVGGFQQARALLKRISPRAILLDVVLGNQDAWSFLAELKADPRTRDIPVLMVTALEDHAKAFALGAEAYGVKPIKSGWLAEQLSRLVRCRALIIDDEESARYTLGQFVRHKGWQVMEAPGGSEGLALLEQTRPEAVFLDLSMPGMGGLDVLRTIRSQPALQDLPVFISTSTVISGSVLAELEKFSARVLPKSTLNSDAVGTALNDASRSFSQKLVPDRIPRG